MSHEDASAVIERLRTALETAQRRFELIAAGVSKETADPAVGARECAAAIAGVVSPASDGPKCPRCGMPFPDAPRDTWLKCSCGFEWRADQPSEGC